MKRNFLSVVIWSALALFSHGAWAESRPAIDHDSLSAAILAQTNRERVLHGLQPLELDPRLARAANGHTKFLVMVGSLRHRSFLPGRETVEARVRAEGLRAAALSENVALITFPSRGTVAVVDGQEKHLGTEQLAAMFVRAWLDSPTHRKNLLNPRFTHLGCAVQTGAGPAAAIHLYSTQVFGRL